MDGAESSGIPAVVGPLLLTMAVAIPLAFVVSLSLLRLYLGAVKRSMHRRAKLIEPDRGPRSVPADGPPPSRPLELSWHTPQPEPAAGGNASALRRAVLVYGAAGLAFALVLALSYFAINGLGFDWLMVAFLTAFYAWPLVLTFAVMIALSWRQVALVVLTYAIVVTLIAAAAIAGSGITIQQLLTVWLNTNAQGTALALLFLARPIRAVGPLVAAFMIAAVAGAITLVIAAGNNETLLYWVAGVGTALNLGVAGTGAALLTAGASIAGLAGWVFLRWLGQAYRKGRVSDQSIMIDALWLMFAVEYGTGLTMKNLWGFAAGTAAFLAFKLVMAAGFRFATLPGDILKAPRLLLLRVFSLGARSGQLFNAFAKRWRYKGSLNMIAGPDLATSTVEPHEFLDFMSGRLQRSFIAGPEDLRHRLDESEPKRDFDGRFRVTSFFCHDDTWQMVLRELTGRSDAVMMDLRGFSAANQGCIYEIEELLAAVPLRRLLLIVDATTEASFLEQTLARGWSKIGKNSPNWAETAPQVHLHRLEQNLDVEVPRLIAALEAAAAAPASSAA